jgi:hypothetical protein
VELSGKIKMPQIERHNTGYNKVNIENNKAKASQTITTVKSPDTSVLGAILGGIIGSIVGMLVWGGVSSLSFVTMKIVGYTAIFVGIAVGVGVIFGGRGKGVVYGMIGLVMTLIALFAGILLSSLLVEARESGRSVTTLLQILFKSPDLRTAIIEDAMTPLNMLLIFMSAAIGFYIPFTGKFKTQ